MSEDIKTVEAPKEVTKVHTREELAQLAKAEIQERVNRCHLKIVAILKEENCELTGMAELLEVPGGGWVINAKPRIIAK